MKNFKVKCIESGDDFKEGKIYEVKDGYLIDDYGYEYGVYENVEEINEDFVSHFELVEEKKTPFQYLLDYYDIKVGEVFLLNGEKFYFDENNVLRYENNSRSYLIEKLLSGTSNVEKLTWKPKDNDKVWKIDAEGFVYEGYFTESLLSNIALLKLGWIFPTKEEAEANKERVIEEMKEVLDGKTY